jgi:Transglycosylase SLT domain
MNPKNPALSVEIVRGTPGFANACHKTAITLAMAAACIQVNAAPTANAFERAAVAPTTAAKQVEKLLKNQQAAAEEPTAEQAQTLKYGIYPPVKTALRINGRQETHWTLHPFDVVRLAREASQKTYAIEGIKIDPAKIGAIMIAESSMVSRVGWSANGKTPSFGLGQLEANTAKSLGVKNVNDPRESAIAVARLLAEGMRFARAHNRVDERLAISLAYNTSTSLRNSLVTQYGRGLTAAHLPAATQSHVKNMQHGEQRMAMYAKLNDAHVIQAKQIPAPAVVAPPALPTVAPVSPAATAPIASNKTPTTLPSTISLIAGGPVEGFMRARMLYNQEQLEKAGHLQAAPITTKGLADMRLALSDHKQRLGLSDSPGVMLVADAAKPMVLAQRSTELTAQNLAQALLDTAQIAYDRLRNIISPSQSTPGNAATLTALLKANQSAVAYMGMGASEMQNLRKLDQSNRQQQIPA